MVISETKKQIVINNYFKNTCDINTSIKEAFTKGFEVGLTKAVFPKDEYEARLKADLVAMLEEIWMEIERHSVIYADGVSMKSDYVSCENIQNIIQMKKNNLLGENKNE